MNAGELPLFMTPNEVANILRVSPCSVRERIREGLLGASRVCRQLRISREELERYVEASKVPKPLGIQALEKREVIRYPECRVAFSHHAPGAQGRKASTSNQTGRGS